MTHELLKKQLFEFSLQKLLLNFNLIFVILILLNYFINGGGKYIDIKSIFSILILSIINIYFLRKKSIHELTLLLGFYLTFFYVFRVFTLSYFSYSSVLDRLDLDTSDLYKVILYISISSVFLYYGIENFKWNNLDKKLDLNLSKNFLLAINVAVLVANILYLLQGVGCKIFYENFIFSIVTYFFGPTFSIPLILIALIFAFLYKNKYLIALSFFTLLLVWVVTIFMGSRGAAIVIAESLLIFFIILFQGRFELNKNKIFYFVMVFILFSFLSLFAFKVGTILRQIHGIETRDIGCTFQSTKSRFLIEKKYLKNYEFDLSNKNNLLKSLFARVGYLDYPAEIIINKNHYSNIFTLKYYVESIIDNVLTPGWDMYDRARVSNSLTFYYNNLGEPKKSIVKDNYQSDQLGIFSEFYILFGVISFAFYYLIGIIFSRLYSIFENKNNLFNFLIKLIVVITFAKIINSYGLDWILFELITNIFGIIFWSILIGIIFTLLNILPKFDVARLNKIK